jgi:hypothetical protein
MSITHYESFNGFGNIQHAPAYPHSLAIERIHMPMNINQDQANMVNLVNFHKASYPLYLYKDDLLMIIERNSLHFLSQNV